ncbi:MAG: BA14K family protein [Rhizobiaceae bacterium]
MKRAIAIFCAVAVTTTTLGASATTAAATSLAMPLGQAAEAQLHEIQYRGNQRPRAQQRTQQRRGFYRQGNRSYYNGHRGYTQRRAGYRQYNGYWFPPAAFVVGAIIGGAIASQPQAARPGRLSQAHVNWCQNRYVSYRLSDNSFQPYNGPRRACHSPYG